MNAEIYSTVRNSVLAKESLKHAYNKAIEAGMSTDSTELDKFYRIWELLTRNFYFLNQIENNEREIQEIVKS